ncbi:hypothetical protein DY000_02039414 [Brassica cretica]|uniref:Copine C-terminal domain-containing protein n=1 Tax=Brassica cretica TaxID=69181 RepID=A0ABQ7BJC6_BRACR|nr:hypothetical protein DY000_02039414 [Brassica cretica]
MENSKREPLSTAIVNESSYALSIVLVSVGDGPWTDMMKFNDKIPKPEFNNL